MSASNFQRSLAAVLKDEGGNDDDPDDHGGRTSRGITQREYTAWLKEEGRPNGDVWTAPQGDIASIYHNEYWLPECDWLPLGVDFQFFSTKVLAGPHRAIVLLQNAVGVIADGRIGPVTRQAIVTRDSIRIINGFCADAVIFYQNLHQPKFLKGWINRAHADRALALLMSEGK